MGFHPHYTGAVWNSSPSYSGYYGLHLNARHVTPQFHSSRGLRQGDPLSPYLFVLNMERLGYRILDAVESGSWSPLMFGRGNGPKLSHLFFADDLILIAEASREQVDLIRSTLAEFCSALGQKVNLNKSQVFFSGNVDDAKASALSNSLGIAKTNDLGRYLGVPLLHHRASKSTYSFILEKMRGKLSSWKSASLSFAGRVTLAQSSLASILGYAMQTTPLPISVIDEAERICRDFI